MTGNLRKFVVHFSFRRNRRIHGKSGNCISFSTAYNVHCTVVMDRTASRGHTLHKSCEAATYIPVKSLPTPLSVKFIPTPVKSLSVLL